MFPIKSSHFFFLCRKDTAATASTKCEPEQQEKGGQSEGAQVQPSSDATPVHVAMFCSTYGIDSESLLTRDVVDCNDFMQCFNYLVKAWANFDGTQKEFQRVLSWVHKNSRGTILISRATESLSDCVEQLKPLSDIKLPTASLLDEAFLASAHKK